MQRYLRARELDQALSAASPSNSEGGALTTASSGGSGGGNSPEWVAPFDQYMMQLDQVGVGHIHSVRVRPSVNSSGPPPTTRLGERPTELLEGLC
jgi:hypothetical protein